ncbi:hypothetical protein E1202_04325 [Saccharopolyspora karakumensis]|uniref:Uncharacterized protein n=1 Tax=Saccharopolyspora karakumensis TaxID=2530386 RepID=A0A4R5BZX5_9PSEU|nr:hypothetical protein [Saccharopolyspora karakumensis]TDD91965.1 hypothetical protein E1202_04325 [Saccharopolyspora karakumensis]
MTDIVTIATSTSMPVMLGVIVAFGFVPGFCLRLIVLMYPHNDPRRTELVSELYAVPRAERPLWVAEQLEAALFEGLVKRLASVVQRVRSALRRAKSDAKRQDQERSKPQDLAPAANLDHAYKAFGAGRASTEASLVERYSQWLATQGRHAAGLVIREPGRSLRADLLDEGLGELIEAKGTANRYQLRFALGQLKDYGRLVDYKHAVLTPVRPTADLVDLLTSNGVACIYEVNDGRFERIEPE